MNIDEAVVTGLRSVHRFIIDEYTARCFQDTLKSCGYSINTSSDNPCPCGISPEAWMFCSAGTCDVCINSKEFINSLTTVSHTDRHTPCPTCGFHVVTYENNSIHIDEDE